MMVCNGLGIRELLGQDYKSEDVVYEDLWRLFLCIRQAECDA